MWGMLCTLEQAGGDEPRHLVEEKQAQRGEVNVSLPISPW